MPRIPENVDLDSPARPWLLAGITYWGTTSGAGNALGTTLVCADLDNWATYVGRRIKVFGGNSDGQDRMMMVHAVGGVITVDDAFTNAAGAPSQIVAGTPFVILSGVGAGGGGGGGMPPTTSLWMFGIVSPAQVGSTTIIDIPHLAGFDDDTFNNNFWMEIIQADGAAPEGEKKRIADYVGATGRFTTDAFTANVEAGDWVAIYHKSIMAIDILGYGTLDTSSATVPADSTRTEGNNYFRGCILMTTEGAMAFRPTRIVEYTGVGGIFTLDPNNPFTAVPGLVDYIIIGGQTEFVPAADAVINRTPSDVIGNKADAAASGVIGATNSLIALLKQAITQQGLIYFGDVTTFTDANNFASTDLAGREDGYFINWYVYCARDDGGAAAAPQGEYRPITAYTSATGAFTHNALSANMAVGDQVMIIHPALYEILNIRGGAGNIASLEDELAALLDVARSTESGTTTTDGTEQNLYDESGDPNVYYFAGGVIDLTNMIAGDTMRIRVYVINRAGGGWIRISDDVVWTFAGAQDPAAKVIDGRYNQYGVRVTIQRTAGVDRDIYHEWFDAKRGS